jgi:hypothetical protein
MRQERHSIIRMIRSYVDGLAPFIYCARQTQYDFMAATKHRPQTTQNIIVAIQKTQEGLAIPGGILQSCIRKQLSAFLPAEASELVLLRETLYQLYLALLNFEIHSDVIPHKDRDPQCRLDEETKRLTKGKWT